MFPENTCIHCGRELPKGIFPLCPAGGLMFSCDCRVPKALESWISLQNNRIAELITPLSYGQRKTELVRRYPGTSLVFNIKTGKYQVDLRAGVKTADCFVTEEQAFDAAFRLANI